MLSGDTVLITGGAGSVGRSIARRVAREDPQVVRLLDNSESDIATVAGSHDDDDFRYFVGDIRDKDRVERAMDDVDVVIHTAAMKHVDISEYNPFEAVKTNVLGLQNVIDAAMNHSVDRFLFTSSDKAANPANTMGTTKLLGERLVEAGNNYAGDTDIVLSSVRFGNVINSSESVIPLFTRQIRQGGPVTLTDDRMTRFFIDTEELLSLMMESLQHMNGGEVFIKQMRAMRIEDLAEAMIETVAPRFGSDPDQIGIEHVGARVGETLHEEILTSREAGRTLKRDDTYAVTPESSGELSFRYHNPKGFTPASDVVRSSAEAEKLSYEEVSAFVEETVAPVVEE